MKKLEKMDGKLFESLKPNEMSNLGALVGGWYDQATENGKDVFRVYDTWANTWAKDGTSSQDNIHEDSRSAVHWYEGVTATLLNNDLSGSAENQVDAALQESM